MTHKLRGVRADENAYYVNKLRQNVSLETWIWRQIVTSQTGHTKYKWPPRATEWNAPHENFLRTPLSRPMTKQRKRENGETMSVVKAQVTICPYVNFAEGTVLTRFTKIWKALR